jgi:hypothetical protein
MKPAFVLPLVFVMMFVMVAPASAGPPDVNTYYIDETSPYQDNPCPGVNIWKHEVYTVRETLYFDKQGYVKSINGHADGIDSFYNPANPDVVLSGHFVVNFEVDPQTGEYLRITGAYYHITAPGYGTVLVRAGLVISPNGHVAGKDSFVDPKDVGQFCSILAGN